jgi:hypothetical protein
MTLPRIPDLTNVPDGDMTYAGMAITLAAGTTRTTISTADKVTLTTGQTGTVHCWMGGARFMVTLDTPTPTITDPMTGDEFPGTAAVAGEGKFIRSIDKRYNRQTGKYDG